MYDDFSLNSYKFITFADLKQITNNSFMAEARRKINPKVVEVPSMYALGHRQPQNLEMETAVLGALMNEPDAV